MTDVPITKLPVCMEPDGAEPCAAYSEVYDAARAAEAEIARLREFTDFNIRRWGVNQSGRPEITLVWPTRAGLDAEHIMKSLMARAALGGNDENAG